MKPEKRIFRLKKPKSEFLCALCGSFRQMRYAKNLDRFQYLQLVVLISTLSVFLYPWTGIRGALFTLFLWPIFEFVHKIMYRHELPCPYCGFDATWYRRDVKMARRKVEQFWEEKGHQAPVVETPLPPENQAPAEERAEL